MKYLFNSLYLLILLFSLVSRSEEVQTMTFEEGMTLVVYTDKANDEVNQAETSEETESE